MTLGLHDVTFALNVKRLSPVGRPVAEKSLALHIAEGLVLIEGIRDENGARNDRNEGKVFGVTR